MSSLSTLRRFTLNAGYGDLVVRGDVMGAFAIYTVRRR